MNALMCNTRYWKRYENALQNQPVLEIFHSSIHEEKFEHRNYFSNIDFAVRLYRGK